MSQKHWDTLPPLNATAEALFLAQQALRLVDKMKLPEQSERGDLISFRGHLRIALGIHGAK